MAIDEAITIAENRGQRLFLSGLGAQLIAEFDGRVWERLGTSQLSDFVLGIANLRVVGSGPRMAVERAVQPPRKVSLPKRETTGGADLRSQVHDIIATYLEDEPSGTAAMTHIGDKLKMVFPSQPVHKMLGFETLKRLVSSYPDFAVEGVHPHTRVRLIHQA